MSEYKKTPAFNEIFALIANPKTEMILDFSNMNEVEHENIILGPKLGVLDTSTIRHKRVVDRFMSFKAADWTWWEFEFHRCIKEWHTVDKSSYQKMIKTIAWQWEGDAAAAIGMLEVIGSFITESASLEYEARITDNEILHSKTYAQMVNNAFADPTEVKREILSSEKVRSRLVPIAKTLSIIAKAGHEYKLGLRQNDQDTYNYGLLYEVIMLILEKIQFNPSFLMTHLLTSDGSFTPIATAVQKIAVDELNYHVPHRKYVISNELSTARGQAAWKSIRPIAQQIFNLVLQSELDWLKYEVFADGKELPGGNVEIASMYTRHCAYDVAQHLGLDSDYELLEKNPVYSMAKWLGIDNTQASPQDEKPGNYNIVSVVEGNPETQAELESLLDDDDE